MAFLAMLLVFLPMTAIGDDLSDAILGRICNETECGKGTCKASLDYKFTFKCECDPGWKRTRFDNEDDVEFLPCVIPNCSLDYSCMTAPPPAPSNPQNESVFDPCYWMYCGEGTCKKTATYLHECQCNTGFSNLLNITAFPCYSDCALGSDCEKLGIKVANSSATPDSHASSFQPGKFHLITIVMMFVAVALWN